MSGLDEQRVLMGINDWDRAPSIDEKRAHKSNTSKWVSEAMGSLRRAKKSAGHRKLATGNKKLNKALSAAYEACKRAQEECYAQGETYEMEEEDLDEVRIDAGYYLGQSVKSMLKGLGMLHKARDKSGAVQKLLKMSDDLAKIAVDMGVKPSTWRGAR